MPLCPEVPDRLIVRSISEPQSRRPLIVAGNLLLAAMLAGCTSIAPYESREVHPTPAVASAPSQRAESWSSQTRRGREALLEREFQTAEILLLSALDTSHSFRSRDVRVDVSYGNLIRLASVYERLSRQDDAKRILAEVESSAGRRRMAIRRIADYRESFEALSTQALSTRLEPVARQASKGSAHYDRLIQNTADSFDVDPALVKAVVAAESNFESRAVSHVGAQGLMQLMPSTARAMGVRRPFAPSENIRGGVRYLRSLLDRFEELDLALAAYNAGPEAVKRHGGIPPYPETEAYVTKVLSHYRRYQKSFHR
jgi:soluble lytic murein transglycosylase-like protein